MADESWQDQRAPSACWHRPAGRRGVLLGMGLAGFGGVLAGCSTAPVPYDANEAGVAPGEEAPTSAAPMAAGAVGQGGMATGTLLGLVTDIPVGGGMIFMSQKVVVTQPAKGEFKAFSAICTHVGCVCNVVANGTINCPCHGSEFKITNGAVVTGPAPTPLPARTIAISDNKIYLA
jgi:Rieske Fe-S protein